MTHDRALAGREHCGHLARPRRRTQTHQVDAMVQPPQPALPHALSHRVPGQPRIEELAEGDHTALTGGNRQQAGITHRHFPSTALILTSLLHLCRSQRHFSSTETAIGPLLRKRRSGHARTLAHNPTRTPSLLPFLTQPARSRQRRGRDAPRRAPNRH